jgi:hypothetical protein
MIHPHYPLSWVQISFFGSASGILFRNRIESIESMSPRAGFPAVTNDFRRRPDASPSGVGGRKTANRIFKTGYNREAHNEYSSGGHMTYEQHEPIFPP